MQISWKREKRIKYRMRSYFPLIRMNWFCVINRPKQLLLVSLPCHNVSTHYGFSNTFGKLGFPSESQYLREWKQNLNTVRKIQICSNLETQWTSQLPWDVHYMRRNKPFLVCLYLLKYLTFILAYYYYIYHSFCFPHLVTKIITWNF